MTYDASRMQVHNHARRLRPPPLPRPMPRFSRSIRLWMLALTVASLLLAWPLHEARHVSQPIAEQVANAAAVFDASLNASLNAAGLVDAGADDHDDTGSSEATGAGCAWCLFHAQHAVAAHLPPPFVFHAEASAPPAAPPRGLPTGRCALAADPRGPPQA